MNNIDNKISKKYEDELITIIRRYGHETEAVHSLADDFLCRVLDELGFEKVTKIFRDMDKWYS